MHVRIAWYSYLVHFAYTRTQTQASTKVTHTPLDKQSLISSETNFSSVWFMGTCTHGVFGSVSTKQIWHSAAKYPNAQAEQIEIDNKYSTKYNDSTNYKLMCDFYLSNIK